MEPSEIFPLVNEEEIMKVQTGNVLFISNNIDIEMMDPEHNEGYINSYNKIDPNTEFYVEFQNSIDDLKNYNHYEGGKIIYCFLAVFIINLIF